MTREEKLETALRLMVAHYGPPESVADICDYPSSHPISMAREALETPKADKRHTAPLVTDQEVSTVQGVLVDGGPAHIAFAKAESTLARHVTPGLQLPYFTYEAVRNLLTAAYFDDPEVDATDGAHPAWWRGQDHGVCMTTASIRKMLRGEKTGTFGFHALNEIRNQIEHLMRGLLDMQTSAAFALEVVPKEEGIVRTFLEAIHRHAASHLAAPTDGEKSSGEGPEKVRHRMSVEGLSAIGAPIGVVDMSRVVRPAVNPGALPHLTFNVGGRTLPEGVTHIGWEYRAIGTKDWNRVPDGDDYRAYASKYGYSVRPIFAGEEL